MPNYAGLAATYPGFLQGQVSQADARLKTGQADDADVTRAGQDAFGRTLMHLQALQNPQAQNGPQPPMPGQPSTPAQPPMAQGEGPPSPGGGMPMVPQQGPAPGGQPPPMPQPTGAQGGLGPQPQGGGMPGGQQNITWQSVAQKVSEANPGASPRVIAAAVDKFMPIMNQQAQQQWQLMRAQIAQSEASRRTTQGDRRLDIGEQNADTRDEDLQRKQQQGDRRLGQGDTRIADQQGERDARQGRFDSRENDRALDRVLKQKKDALSLELQRERNAVFAAGPGMSTDQLKTRLDAAQQRHDAAVARIDSDPAFKAPEPKAKPTASAAPAAARAPATASFDDRFQTEGRNIVSDGKGKFLELIGNKWVPVQQ